LDEGLLNSLNVARGRRLKPISDIRLTFAVARRYRGGVIDTCHLHQCGNAGVSGGFSKLRALRHGFALLVCNEPQP
jgi:hypothetical protein